MRAGRGGVLARGPRSVSEQRASACGRAGSGSARAYADWEGRCSARNRRKRSACRGTGWAGLAGPAGRERSGLGRLGWCGKE